MTKVVYDVVEHDGGWAYRVNDTISETFPSHDAARAAAVRAAREQHITGESLTIVFQDADGIVREETTTGRDHPETDVRG